MKYVLIAAAIFLAGCDTMPKVPDTVKVPIAVPCPVEVPTPPQYQFGNLKPTDNIWTKVKVLLSDRQLSIAYEEELKAALMSCK